MSNLTSVIKNFSAKAVSTKLDLLDSSSSSATEVMDATVAEYELKEAAKIAEEIYNLLHQIKTKVANAVGQDQEFEDLMERLTSSI